MHQQNVGVMNYSYHLQSLSFKNSFPMTACAGVFYSSYSTTITIFIDEKMTSNILSVYSCLKLFTCYL